MHVATSSDNAALHQISAHQTQRKSSHRLPVHPNKRLISSLGTLATQAQLNPAAMDVFLIVELRLSLAVVRQRLRESDTTKHSTSSALVCTSLSPRSLTCIQLYTGLLQILRRTTSRQLVLTKTLGKTLRKILALRRSYPLVDGLSQQL